MTVSMPQFISWSRKPAGKENILPDPTSGDLFALAA